MATLFVRHKVAAYAAWRETYNAFDPTRKALGVTADAVYQAADDPNEVTVTHDFATLEAAKAFVANSELHEAMDKSGVVGEPAIWITNRS
ncbi:MAG: cyclase [Chloroflexota bacterium]